ncbi:MULTISPECIES: hypothetical protein [Pseudomonas]|jgi:hypothetical protein|uniref:hypothetical protein n=1 Tax=Pseudomonas TaxID=286 RepID=UPI00353209FA
MHGHHASLRTPKAGSRKARQLKVYTKPHSGEVIVTEGGNHAGLKRKAEHAVKLLSLGWPSDFDLTTQGALFEGLLYFLVRSGVLFAPLVFSSIKIAS